MPTITTNLWFNDQAEAAAKFYVSIFDNAKLGEIAYYPDEGQEITGQSAGSVMTVIFELNGSRFVALNGGSSDFTFNEATSFIIYCDTQDEVDHYWNSLTADGGAEVQCGWLKDKYGVSWQVIPHQLDELLANPDPDKAKKTMRAMLGMKKIVIADLEAAAKE